MKPLLLIFVLLFPFVINGQPPATSGVVRVDLRTDKSDIDTICGKKDSLLLIPNDTFYVMNELAFRDFWNLYEVYQTLPDQMEQLQLALGELDGIDTDFDSLMVNVDELESKYSESLLASIKNAETLQQQNVQIQANLDQARKELSEAETKIKAERWNKLGGKLLWATGGLLVGVLAVSLTD